MGKLSIVGNAEKEYEYDLMDITISFNSRAVTTKEATKKTNEQCEEFLAIIKGKGIPTECIRAEENSIKRDGYGERRDVTATKGVIIETKLDIPLINFIMEVISENDYSAELDTDYRFSDESKIEQELLAEAIEDSKKRATFIAENMGQTIKGIKSVDIRDSDNRHILDRFANKMKFSDCDYSEERFEHSNQLEAPTELKSSSVEVVWNIG